MKRHYIKAGLICALLGTSLFAQAIEKPMRKVQKLTDGGKYIIFNAANPTGYTSRTSWDGAVYFLGETDSNWSKYEVTAKKNSDGTWSFSYTETSGDGSEATYYMAIPSGTCNLNFKATEPVAWTIQDGDYSNYYKLIAGEGNNSNTLGMMMHLNSGGIYFVISEADDGGQWYPDFYGGAKTDAEGNELSDEKGNAIMADSTSMNWAFVLKEDVPEFAREAKAYSSIANYEKEYLSLEGYTEGFKIAYDQAAQIYEGDEFVAGDEDDIATILDARVALYTAIENAKSKNTDDDAALNNAIATATNVFNTAKTTDDIDNAKTTLNKAIEAYQQGTGDLTSLGQNMSFEDLSAQGGNASAGVEAVPTGWNMYINGTQVNTADEIKSAGINTWCAVNADCYGEGIKDGNYGFGIWNASIPDFELSQTITGLENGTYTISAAFMVGANDRGTRRTTQRIFGNLNHVYWGSEEEYDADKLNASEVKTYAGLTEETTDNVLQPISLRAYVYDGTLTFGVKTDGNVAAALRSASNSAGGDGWFKVDNFTIQKEGFSMEDAIAVPNYYLSMLTEYANGNAMNKDVNEKLTALLDKYTTFDETADMADVNAAIVDLSTNISTAEASVNAYKKLGSALEQAYLDLETYSDRKGAEDFGLLISDIQSTYDDGEYLDSEIDSVISEIDKALEVCIKSGVAVGIYVTDLITNPSFEDQSAQGGSDSAGVTNPPKGWTLTIDGKDCATADEINEQGVNGWCAINSGDVISVELDGEVITKQPTDGDKLFGIWNRKMPAATELSQTITGLPAGTYTLTADVMVQYDWAKTNLTSQRIFANDYITMYTTAETSSEYYPEDVKEAIERSKSDADIKHINYGGYTSLEGDPTTSLLHTLTVKFGVDESGVAKIGFRTSNINPAGEVYGETVNENDILDGQGWFKVDNFTLFYDSKEIPTGIKNTGVEEKASYIVERRYYSTDGARIAAPQDGVTIVQNIMSDGSVKVTKVIK